MAHHPTCSAYVSAYNNVIDPEVSCKFNKDNYYVVLGILQFSQKFAKFMFKQSAFLLAVNHISLFFDFLRSILLPQFLQPHKINVRVFFQLNILVLPRSGWHLHDWKKAEAMRKSHD